MTLANMMRITEMHDFDIDTNEYLMEDTFIVQEYIA